MNVPYHTVKYTPYHESQSKRFEKGCSSQTELAVSLLCSVFTVQSPRESSRPHCPPVLSSQLPPSVRISPIRPGHPSWFPPEAHPGMRMFVWEVTPKSAGEGMEEGNRRNWKYAGCSVEQEDSICWGLGRPEAGMFTPRLTPGSVARPWQTEVVRAAGVGWGTVSGQSLWLVQQQ